MGINSDVVRAEPHVEIGVLIECSADLLVERWCKRALDEHRAAKRVHADALRDHLPKFLRAMGRALAQSGEAEAEQRSAAALQHGEERWESGWSLPEVVHDYQLMRLVILEYLEETLCRPLYCREAMAIGVFVDDAIAESISAYMASRDAEHVVAEKERAAQLEETNRRKDEFMAMLGHELRNPLAPIETSLRVVQAVLPTPPKAAATALEVIGRQTKHLVRLVDDILDLVRIGQGRFELRKSRVSLAAIVEQAVQTSAPVVTARRHELALELPPANVAIEADSERLVQVVCNLINNAAKYTEPGGHIRVIAEADTDWAIVRVRDDGIGIPAGMLTRVFDLFTQVEGTDARAEGGMGIGLALVKRLVEQHGGTAECRSEGPGMGSEFTIRVPLRSPSFDKRPEVLTAAGLRVVGHSPQKSGER